LDYLDKQLNTKFEEIQNSHQFIWLSIFNLLRVLPYLKNESDFFTANKLKVLHIAPEQCFYSKFKAQKNLDYLTGDLESPLADLHFDLHHIPLEDNQFDVVFCNHVMEHVDDPIQCMTELFRVMKIGGWAIMQVPQDFSRETTYEDASITSPEDREKHFWQKDHVRLFGKDYPQWLEKSGFSVDVFELTNHYDQETIDKFKLMQGELLYIARKK
jgi:SAM-dependent methyltransferase